MNQPPVRLITLALTLALIVLAACTAIAPPVPHISAAALGTTVQSGEIVNPASTFEPAAHMIHLVVHVDNVLTSTSIGAKWYALPAGAQPQLLFSSDLALDPLNTSADFTLTAANDWTPGAYKVDLTLDGKQARTLEFTIKP